MKSYLTNAEMNELNADEVIVYIGTGEPVMSMQDYTNLIDREMREWWDNAADDEREDYVTLENYLSSARDEWIESDDVYTTLADYQARQEAAEQWF